MGQSAGKYSKAERWGELHVNVNPGASDGERLWEAEASCGMSYSVLTAWAEENMTLCQVIC